MIEDAVWSDIKEFVMNPGEVLEQLEAAMESQLADIPKIEERRKELERILRSKESENDRMTDAYRHGVVDLDTLEEHVKRSRVEIEPLQAEYMALMADESGRATTVEDISNVGELLRALQDTIEGPLDWETRRSVIEGLVSGIVVETAGTGRKKTASVTVTYNFQDFVSAAEKHTP